MDKKKLKKIAVQDNYRTTLFQHLDKLQQEIHTLETGSDRRKKLPLLAVQQASNIFYTYNQLFSYCRQLNVLQNKGKKLEPLPPHVIDYINQYAPCVYGIEVFNLIRLLRTEHTTTSVETNRLEQLEILLNKKRKGFSIQDKVDAYSLLTNHCNWRIGKCLPEQRPYFLRKYFIYNNCMLNLKEYAVRAIPLPVPIYRNLVATAVAIEDRNFWQSIHTIGLKKRGEGFQDGIEWATLFAQKLQRKLPQKYKKVMLNYANSLVAFYAKEYSTTYNLLKDQLKKDVRLGRYYRLHQFKLFAQATFEVQLETGDEPIIDLTDFVHRFRQVVYSEKGSRDPDQQIAILINFINLFRQLYEYLTEQQHQGTAKQQRKYKNLCSDIQQCQYPFAEWFREKLTQIKQPQLH